MSTVKIGDREVNLKGALPLTIGDWKKLKTQGVTIKDLGNTDIDDMSKIIYHVLHKADGSITMEDVDGIGFGGETMGAIMKALSDSQNLEEEDESFLEQSTPSPQPTDGIAKT